MRVLVCGGRTYSDRARVYGVLNKINEETPIDMIIHGGAPGADSLAGDWAAFKMIDCLRVPAMWHVHGNAAGPRRNQRMLDIYGPQLVVAFPGGAGTADMVRRATKAEVKVMEVSP